MTHQPTSSIPFEKRRFESTAAYYDRFRAPYDEAVISWAARAVGLDASCRVLDLGTGPGSLAIPFARLAGEVVAIDPEPEMLAQARHRAAEAGVDIRFIEGSSNDLSVTPGPFRLATMGRSFHWMDRPATLAALDALLDPGGAVALFASNAPRSAPWWNKAREIAERHVAEGMTANRWRREPGWIPHEAVLLASPFAHVERYATIRLERIDLDHVVGRLFSMSSTSPKRLGDRRDAFERDLRETLPALARDGLFEGIVETQVILARRG
jgi:ubiquinone/menaquinone biosynthesis C-methylase UbiE